MDTDKFRQGGSWIPARDGSSDWLLIAIHGSGGSARDFEGLEEILSIPALNYLYLNGPISDYSGYRWYSDLGARTEAYEALSEAMVVAASEGFSPERTFLLGFSQGAALTLEFGVRYPHLLAGYIAISGRVENLPGLFAQGNPQILREGEFLVTHGTRDFNLSVDLIREQVEKMRQEGMKLEYREFDKIHEFDSKRELPMIGDWIRSRMSGSA